jgi:hypothetical protein
MNEVASTGTFREKLITGSPGLSRFSAALVNPSILTEHYGANDQSCMR